MILVTGATGAIGRPLVELLVSEGAHVRAVTRSAERANLPTGVDIVEGDPSLPGTIAPHLDGVTAVFLHSRTFGESADKLLALAGEHGATRVVALSAMNIDDPLEEQPSRFRGDRNKEAEAAAVASGLEWTSLRAGSFAGNTLHAWGAQIRNGDVVRYVYAAFEESLIDERDLVEVAARALLTDELVGRRLELTGPEQLSHQEMVAVIGRVLGRPLRFEQVPPEALKQAMSRPGFPEPFVDALMARYTKYSHQAQHPVTRDVEQVLGRPARTYAGWVTDHAAAFQN